MLNHPAPTAWGDPEQPLPYPGVDGPGGRGWGGMQAAGKGAWVPSISPWPCPKISIILSKIRGAGLHGDCACLRTGAAGDAGASPGCPPSLVCAPLQNGGKAGIAQPGGQLFPIPPCRSWGECPGQASPITLLLRGTAAFQAGGGGAGAATLPAALGVPASRARFQRPPGTAALLRREARARAGSPVPSACADPLAPTPGSAARCRS